MVSMNYDATQFDPNTGAGDIFESGEYTFHIVESKTAQTKKGDGTMLVFTAECLDPAGSR